MAIDTKFQELEPSMWKAFRNTALVFVYEIYTTMKNGLCHHLENFRSFPVMYRFEGIRCILMELEADNRKRRSNYMVTLKVNGFLVKCIYMYPVIEYSTY